MSLISSLDRLFRLKHSQPAARQTPPRARPVVAADRFEAAARPRVNLGGVAAASAASDAQFVKGLYQELLHREPDLEGFASHIRGLQAGMSRDEIRNVFLNSPEFRQLQASPPVTAPTPPAGPVPAPPPSGTPAEPGAPLNTVPSLPEYATATIDKSSQHAAVLSAAKWAKAAYPELFERAKAEDASGRQACYEIMTKVIGGLRAAGFDANRVVNHPSRPVGDGYRYGTDSLVVNRRVYDVYVAMGEASTPAANDVGEYAAGRLRE